MSSSHPCRVRHAFEAEETECKGPEEMRLVHMPGTERGPGQLRRVIDGENDRRGGERHGRTQITGGLATLSKEFDFTGIWNRKGEWGIRQSRLMIQPINTVCELDPNRQAQKFSEHLRHE